jgi:hypothetical protein
VTFSFRFVTSSEPLQMPTESEVPVPVDRTVVGSRAVNGAAAPGCASSGTRCPARQEC